MQTYAAWTRFAQAQAKAHADQSKAYADLANDLLDAASIPVPPTSTPSRADPAAEHNLGVRQQQIVKLEGLNSQPGMSTPAISAAIGQDDVPNTYQALQALVRRKIVEQVPNVSPQHWRLTRRYRRTDNGASES